MRRALSLALLLLLAGASFAQAPQQQLNQTLSTLKQSRAQEAQLKKDLADTSRELDRLRGRATDLAASVQENERSTSRAEAKLADSNRALIAKEKEFAQRRQEYAHTVVSLIRMRQLPPTAMFAPPEELEKLMQAGEALQQTNRVLASRAQALKNDLQAVKQLRESARQSKLRATREQAQLKARQNALADDLQARQTLQAKLNRDHAQAQARVAKLSRESASLQELIGKIETTPQMAPKRTAPVALTTPSPGGLRVPVAGSLRHRFGDRKSANETYRGLVFGARSGATVVAPYGGEVVFTGPFMDYGRMVLLKHGNGYITLLAGLGSISVGLNQQLGKGEPLGSAGGQGLYLELRQRSKPIDPTRWFAKLPS